MSFDDDPLTEFLCDSSDGKIDAITLQLPGWRQELPSVHPDLEGQSLGDMDSDGTP